MSESVEKRSSPREEKIPERIPEIVKGQLPAEIWKVLKQDKTAFCGFFVILGLVALAVLAPWIAPYDFSEQHIVHSFKGPSGKFWLGTDEFGRDLLMDMGVEKRKKTERVEIADDCIGCRVCIDHFECPAIEADPDTGMARIDQTVCSACGVCIQVCPQNAIQKK